MKRKGKNKKKTKKTKLPLQSKQKTIQTAYPIDLALQRYAYQLRKFSKPTSSVTPHHASITTPVGLDDETMVVL